MGFLSCLNLQDCQYFYKWKLLWILSMMKACQQSPSWVFPPFGAADFLKVQKIGQYLFFLKQNVMNPVPLYLLCFSLRGFVFQFKNYFLVYLSHIPVFYGGFKLIVSVGLSTHIKDTLFCNWFYPMRSHTYRSRLNTRYTYLHCDGCRETSRSSRP